MAPAPDRHKDPLFHPRMICPPGRGLDFDSSVNVVSTQEIQSVSLHSKPTGQALKSPLGPGLLVATFNPGKLREMESFLAATPVELVSLKAIPGVTPAAEEGTTFEANARQKAIHYSRFSQLPTIADDSGLLVDALGGRPGVYSARYLSAQASDEERCRKILEELRQVADSRRTARFECWIALARGGVVLEVFRGTPAGRDRTRGQGGQRIRLRPHLPGARAGLLPGGVDSRGEAAHQPPGPSPAKNAAGAVRGLTAGVSPHRISLRLPARLLRLPLKGGVIPEFFEVGLVDWRRDHLLGASSALSAAQHHSPLEGESARQGRSPQSSRWGAHSPPPEGTSAARAAPRWRCKISNS